MATGTIANNAKATLISTTYISNSYVTESEFNALFFYQLGRLVIAYFNLRVSASPGTTFRTIGKVNLPRSSPRNVNITLASQNNESTLLVTISGTTGEISIYSNGNASGYYRGVFPLLLS